ncbi:hypothetical protein BDF21DRAFT_398999 [Thamnidium elegans]|nr:hypothetical protein BDF21DRAFT_398999 [Thamnidium elegans]
MCFSLVLILMKHFLLLGAIYALLKPFDIKLMTSALTHLRFMFFRYFFPAYSIGIIYQASLCILITLIQYVVSIGRSWLLLNTSPFCSVVVNDHAHRPRINCFKRLCC